ncbi:MAG: hypothetical protein OEZ21_03295 [Candidatus Bathyarchaeota archaeon]|nr:hypothetical protein [Candidatus Bathyarchaeota archaeon]MDH5745969.1 hypothetical protein [Candidatus Bathyarchaeota archaeon]
MKSKFKMRSLIVEEIAFNTFTACNRRERDKPSRASQQLKYYKVGLKG